MEKPDTRSMLEEGFLKNYMETSGAKKAIKPQVKSIELPLESDTRDLETILVKIYEIKDDLMICFSKCDFQSDLGQLITKNIKKANECIKELGGQAEDFNPLNHLSGLQSPNIHKNASRVVENTKDSYNLGKIEDANISKDGKSILITFAGLKSNVSYRAKGEISTVKSWVGNEAIDYIYTEGSGKMYVKALNDDGKWIDKSNAYKISWELYETDIQPESFDRKASATNDKNEQNDEIKEDIEIIEENNISQGSKDNFIDEDIANINVKEN